MIHSSKHPGNMAHQLLALLCIFLPPCNNQINTYLAWKHFIFKTKDSANIVQFLLWTCLPNDGYWICKIWQHHSHFVWGYCNQIWPQALICFSPCKIFEGKLSTKLKNLMASFKHHILNNYICKLKCLDMLCLLCLLSMLWPIKCLFTFFFGFSCLLLVLFCCSIVNKHMVILTSLETLWNSTCYRLKRSLKLN